MTTYQLYLHLRSRHPDAALETVLVELRERLDIINRTLLQGLLDTPIQKHGLGTLVHSEIQDYYEVDR